MFRNLRRFPPMRSRFANWASPLKVGMIFPYSAFSISEAAAKLYSKSDVEHGVHPLLRKWKKFLLLGRVCWLYGRPCFVLVLSVCISTFRGIKMKKMGALASDGSAAAH